MSETLKLSAAYPGMEGLEGASYTCSHGKSPGVLQIDLQTDVKDFAGVGDFTFSDGSRTLVVPECKVVNVVGDFSVTNANITVYLHDRRHRWVYGSITGEYNIPKPRIADIPKLPDYNQQPGNPQPPAPEDPATAPQIEEWSRKHARDLCKMCFEAMGEQKYGFDVTQVPKDQYPYVNWTAENPADALVAIGEQYGLRLVYNPVTNRAGLFKLGEGADLPPISPSDVEKVQLGFDPPEPPDTITVYGAIAKFQMRFRLRAVGLDFDGRTRPIEDLSYKPASVNGMTWDNYGGPFNFVADTNFAHQLPAGYTYRDAAQLANQSVFRWYQIYTSLPLVREGEMWVPHRVQKCKLFDIQLTPLTVETSVDALGQRNQVVAKILTGERYSTGVYQGNLTNRSTSIGEEVKIPFAIDPEKGLVMFQGFVRRRKYVGGFSQPLFKFADADLILETAVTCRDVVTHQFVRYRKQFPVTIEGKPPKTPGAGVLNELPLVREDIQFYRKINYVSTTDHRENTVESNESECDKRAEYYFKAELAKYETLKPETRAYNGIYPGILDGAIQQISWLISLNDVSTVISRNNEHSHFIAKYQERRKREEASLEYTKRQADQAAMLKRLTARRDDGSGYLGMTLQ